MKKTIKKSQNEKYADTNVYDKKLQVCLFEAVITQAWHAYTDVMHMFN